MQLFSTAFRTALLGVVANLEGLVAPGGEAGAAIAARWLFGSFTLAPPLCSFGAWRIATAL